MAISRPLLFVLLATLVLFAVVTGVRVMGASGSSEPATPALSAATSSSSSTAAGGGSSGVSESASRSTRPTTSSGGGTPVRAESGARAGRRGKAVRGEGVPAKVARALDRREVVVLFFGAQGHDDRATRRAAKQIRGHGAAVFVDSPYHLEEYARIVGALPITQVPSTIVIDRNRRARVIEASPTPARCASSWPMRAGPWGNDLTRR